jgi:hypothetical protein
MDSSWPSLDVVCPCLLKSFVSSTLIVEDKGVRIFRCRLLGADANVHGRFLLSQNLPMINVSG